MEGAQMNTLDRPWFGQISWMSSMYCAACRAGEAMANEMGDTAFAAKCRKIADAGLTSISTKLWNGEYFICIPDPKHLDTVTSGDGCLLDQVYGQSTAHQLGLPRVLPADKTRTALESMWKYNFSPDAGKYFQDKHGGRQFVNPGDMGLIICTFPRTDWDYVKASGGDAAHGGFAYYFVECWTGNEYQVANHMFWEGMTEKALAVVRAIHERYSALKRNPWNEIECGDHYSRAMAGHGPFLAACGFSFHGPLGKIGFAPKLTPENFRAPFIGSEGWGTYAQTITGGKMSASVELKSGQLKAQTLTFAGAPGSTVKAMLSGQSVAVTAKQVEGQLEIQFATPAHDSDGRQTASGHQLGLTGRSAGSTSTPQIKRDAGQRGAAEAARQSAPRPKYPALVEQPRPRPAQLAYQHLARIALAIGVARLFLAVLRGISVTIFARLVRLRVVHGIAVENADGAFAETRQRPAVLRGLSLVMSMLGRLGGLHAIEVGTRRDPENRLVGRDVAERDETV